MEELIQAYELDILKEELKKESKEVIENIKLLSLQSQMYGLNNVLMILATELIQEVVIDATDRKYLEKLATELKKVNYGNIEEARSYIFLTASILWERQMFDSYYIYLKVLKLASELLVINQI